MAKLDLAFQLTANADGVASGVAKADRELSKVGARSKATSAEFRQAAKITAEVRTPTEKYADTVAKLDKMLEKGLLTQEVYGRAVSRAEAEMKAATSSMDDMASAASIAERVLNGTSNAIKGVADATKSVADAGVSVIKFGKDVAWTYLQWRVFSSIRNPSGLKDFAVSALKTAMVARTAILAAKAFGIGLALTGGTAGTAAAAVLGLTNPLIGLTLLAVNVGRAFLSAKDRVYEMAAGLTEGSVSVQQLTASLGAVQAQQIDNLAFAAEGAAEAAKRSDAAWASFGDAFAMPFVGAFTAIQSGMNDLTNGLANVMEGVTSIITPIGQAFAPVLTLLATGVEIVLRLAGAFLDTVGVVLKLAGAVIQTFLSPFIVGLTNLVDTIRSGVGAAFDYFGSQIDWLNGKIKDFYEFMSKVPIIGGAFAGGNAAAPALEQAAAAMENVAAAAETVDDEMEAVNRAIAQQEKHLSNAVDKASEYGQAGFDAAVAYQEELRRLESQLQAGILNETAFANAADQAREKFEGQIDAIDRRNKALAQQAEEDRKAEQSQQKAITQQTDAFFKATEQAHQFGQAGTMAAHEYEVGLTKLNEQLNDGRINEETYGREADKLKQKFDKQIDAQEKLNDRNEKIAAKQEEIDQIAGERAGALSGKSNEALKANDVRSSEGMAQFIALATGREDPAIEEYRKQTRKLDELKAELRALQNQPVDILLGAA